MIKKLFSLVLVAGTLSVNAQQVQNPGFETWANSFPTGWGSLGQMVVNAGGSNPNTEIQTTTVHSGNFAVLLQNEFVTLANKNLPGAVMTGPLTLNTTTGKIAQGFQAYSSQPLSFDFWYKFNAVNADSAAAILYLTHWNTVSNKRDTLAYGAGAIIGVTSIYTHMTVPITWTVTGTAPDSIQLLFVSSTGNAPAGGQLYLDDVNMNTPLGIESLMADGTFSKAYPNPSNGVLNLTISQFDNEKAISIEVYDIAGKCVHRQIATSANCQIDLSQLNNGVYNLSIIGSKGVENKRVVITR